MHFGEWNRTYVSGGGVFAFNSLFEMLGSMAEAGAGVNMEYFQFSI